MAEDENTPDESSADEAQESAAADGDAGQDTVMEPAPPSQETVMDPEPETTPPSPQDTVMEDNPETAHSAAAQNATVMEPNPETAASGLADGTVGQESDDNASIGLRRSTDDFQGKTQLGEAPGEDTGDDLPDQVQATYVDPNAHSTPAAAPPADDVADLPDLSAQTINDAPSGAAPDLTSDTVMGGAMAGDIPDLTARTLTDDMVEYLPDLEVATIMGAPSPDEPLVDFAAGTIMDPDGELEKLWMATITGDADEGMTLKGEDVEIEETGVGHASSQITVNVRAFTDLTKAKGGVAVHNRPMGGKGDFELIKVLGEGGMGIVYQGRQTSIDRSVAIKMIKSHAAHNKTVRDKFLAEASVTGDLDHPNIVPIYDLGANNEGALFYAMKHVRGDPWSEVIKGKTQEENIEIIIDVCNALAFAHDRGVIHRDLKPENVMLGGYGEVLLMDWGLAAAVTHDAKAERIGVKASICGTPAYMSPEMSIGDGEKIGVVSDIYLMGAILFEAIAGAAPHTGKTVMKCLENSALNVIRETDVTGELMDIAMKAMASEVEDRYQTITEFMAAIKDYESHIESNNLADRAQEDFEEGKGKQEYNDYAKSVFGFQEAMNLWKGNKQARDALTEVRISYAECALGKGDLDLAESQLVEMGPRFKALRQKVVDVRADRDAQERRGKLFKKVTGILLIVVVVIVIGAGIWVTSEKAKADAAKVQATKAANLAVEKGKVAKAAVEEAKVEKELAQKAKEAAAKEKVIAKKALDDAAKEKDAALRSKQEADTAKKEADIAKQEAVRAGVLTKNQTALTGAEATALQLATAKEFALPIERSIDLAGRGGVLKFRLIPHTPKEYLMGSPVNERGRMTEEFRHRVVISQPFYMSTYEVTQGQWRTLMKNNPSINRGKKVGARHPVDNVSWDEVTKQFLPAIQKFAPKGYVFSLPTEAEWEYACRAASDPAYFFGNDSKALTKYAWFFKNARKMTHPVGRKKPNPWGLHDMYGNVAEWCEDIYDDRYYVTFVHNQSEQLEQYVDPVNKTVPKKFIKGKRPNHVVRGGSIGTLAVRCRSSQRADSHPAAKRKVTGRVIGFRLVLRSIAPIRKDTRPTPATPAAKPAPQ